MKKIILVLVIYFTGCVCGYRYTKFNIIRDKRNKVWTKGDRTFSIFFCSASWLSVLAMAAVEHGIDSIENNEKAEW